MVERAANFPLRCLANAQHISRLVGSYDPERVEKEEREQEQQEGGEAEAEEAEGEEVVSALEQRRPRPAGGKENTGPPHTSGAHPEAPPHVLPSAARPTVRSTSHTRWLHRAPERAATGAAAAAATAGPAAAGAGATGTLCVKPRLTRVKPRPASAMSARRLPDTCHTKPRPASAATTRLPHTCQGRPAAAPTLLESPRDRTAATGRPAADSAVEYRVPMPSAAAAQRRACAPRALPLRASGVTLLLPPAPLALD